MKIFGNKRNVIFPLSRTGRIVGLLIVLSLTIPILGSGCSVFKGCQKDPTPCSTDGQANNVASNKVLVSGDNPPPQGSVVVNPSSSGARNVSQESENSSSSGSSTPASSSSSGSSSSSTLDSSVQNGGSDSGRYSTSTGNPAGSGDPNEILTNPQREIPASDGSQNITPVDYKESEIPQDYNGIAGQSHQTEDQFKPAASENDPSTSGSSGSAREIPATNVGLSSEKPKNRVQYRTVIEDQ